jgi:hypothetical protein
VDADDAGHMLAWDNRDSRSIPRCVSAGGSGQPIIERWQAPVAARRLAGEGILSGTLVNGLDLRRLGTCDHDPARANRMHALSAFADTKSVAVALTPFWR